MTTALDVGGPVSAALEAELRSRVAQQGVVVWLDLHGHFTGFVDRLLKARAAGALPYEVRAFRGSHLALMRGLADVAGGAERVPLVVHLPGFNEDTVTETPLLELYRAGVRYRKALDTLVNEASLGRVEPAEVARFREQDGLTLEAADEWLRAAGPVDASGFDGLLTAMGPTAVFEQLVAGGVVANRVVVADDAATLWARLSRWTGLPTTWREVVSPRRGAEESERAGDVAYVAASWALCVEYVHDLKREPVNAALGGVRGLPAGAVKTCRELAAYLRARHPAFYTQTADGTEAVLADEVARAEATDLGKIDTFEFEEAVVLRAALAALGEARWAQALEWAEPRVGTGAGSFWVAADPSRQSAWELVLAAGRLGAETVAAGTGLTGCGSLEEAVDAYVARGAAVDQAHRHLEQRRASLWSTELPEFDVLRARVDGMRKVWRAWADGWARDFNGLCRTQGFLPGAGYQQRGLFDEVVRPMTKEPGTTAYFVVDALRFEMGEELRRLLADPAASTVHLKARLAELPSVTEVGMNVLAPVAKKGRLAPAMLPDKIIGFSAGEFRVSDPESRKRAMQDRVGGVTCPWLSLEDVVSRDRVSLKRAVAQASLVVVHSLEIDEAGEKGMGPAVFDQVMQKLRKAWQLLREAGVRRFVVTSDHGFLLLDGNLREAQSRGRVIDPKRRHVFTTVAADHADEVRVGLSELGYDGVGGYVVFPESTAVFDTGKRSMTFVHGGNSLQERVIPVLTVVHRADAGGSTLQYSVTAAARDGVGGMHCVEVAVEVAGALALDFGSSKEVEVALRVADMDGVQVELCQTRGKARIVGGAVAASVGEKFELFFRLMGPVEGRALVEVHHPGAVATVESCVVEARFEVRASSGAATGRDEEAAVAPRVSASWLEQLPAGGLRQVFAHLSAHGAVTEEEVAEMLGGARQARRFAGQFEELVSKAPFAVTIAVVSGVKRYVRHGSGG